MTLPVSVRSGQGDGMQMVTRCLEDAAPVSDFVVYLRR
jgi:hypothetical protein